MRGCDIQLIESFRQGPAARAYVALVGVIEPMAVPKRVMNRGQINACCKTFWQFDRRAPHPFREGNGRISRLLARLMAAQAGIEIAGFNALVECRREEYFAAVRAGLDRNYSPMRGLFSAMINVGEP